MNNYKKLNINILGIIKKFKSVENVCEKFTILKIYKKRK